MYSETINMIYHTISLKHIKLYKVTNYIFIIMVYFFDGGKPCFYRNYYHGILVRFNIILNFIGTRSIKRNIFLWLLNHRKYIFIANACICTCLYSDTYLVCLLWITYLYISSDRTRYFRKNMLAFLFL